jgi:hypothetical protein
MEHHKTRFTAPRTDHQRHRVALVITGSWLELVALAQCCTHAQWRPPARNRNTIEPRSLMRPLAALKAEANTGHRLKISLIMTAATACWCCCAQSKKPAPSMPFQ